jgi:hypothetical protein
MSKKMIEIEARKVLLSRYQPDAERCLEKYFKLKDFEQTEKVDTLLKVLRKCIVRPENKLYPYLSREIIDNNSLIREIVLTKLTEFQSGLMESRKTNIEQVTEFFVSNHEFIKYSLNQWWLVNPGTLFEFIKIPKTTETNFLKWLMQRFEVKIGDLVLYRHVISENGRNRLKAIKFPVPYLHWNKSYTVDALGKAADLMIKFPKCKGIWNEGSWIYDPKLYKKSSDGKPFVAFTFIGKKKLFGYRLLLGNATPTNIYSKHYFFATRNERRKRLAIKGEFTPRVYGVFYPSLELVKNFSKI